MMAVLINALVDLPMPEDAYLGRALIEVTDIQSTPYPGISVVPDRCRATFDRRLLMGETAESVLSEIQALVDRLQQQDGNFRVRVEVARADVTTYTGHRLQAAKFAPAWMTDRNHPLVRKAAAGLAGAGISPRFGTYQFCTNGSYAAVVEGITTIGFGPGQEEQAHTIDEFVTVDQLLQAAAGYAAMARSAGRAVS
ncbi:MAG: M20/M25/M40 family metallo-hydrolase, partial [Thermaerobacterales bacterium]